MSEKEREGEDRKIGREQDQARNLGFIPTVAWKKPEVIH